MDEESSAQEGEGSEHEAAQGKIKVELAISLVDPVGIGHLRLPQALVHVVFVVGLVEPTLLKPINAVNFCLAIWNWWYNLFESHIIIIIWLYQLKLCLILFVHRPALSILAAVFMSIRLHNLDPDSF